jgi:hypothetical protein
MTVFLVLLTGHQVQFVIRAHAPNFGSTYRYHAFSCPSKKIVMKYAGLTPERQFARSVAEGQTAG